MDSDIRVVALNPFVGGGSSWEPKQGGFRLSLSALLRTCGVRTAHSIESWDPIAAKNSLSEELLHSLETAQLVIADVSDGDPGVLFRLGMVKCLGKPALVFASLEARLPEDVLELPVVFYDPAEISEDGSLPVAIRVLQPILQDPAALLSSTEHANLLKQSVFISYSHADSSYLERLLVHLRPIERQGLVHLWADTNLRAGDRWRDEIQKALDRARVAVLLVSPDFLDSEFVLDNELPNLLSKARSKGTQILPLILSPCRYARDRQLSVFQALNDPRRPLASMPKPEQEALYDKVAERIERIFSGMR
jgi:TIR domain